MSKSSLYVHLRFREYPSEDDISVEVPIACELFEKVLVPIDIPSEDAGPFARYLCTHREEINIKLKDRKQLAEILSTHITNLLVDEFGKRDTIMGFKQKK